MPIKRLLFVVAAALAGYCVVSHYRQEKARSGAQTPPSSPYKPIIADVLHQHEGEESPMVQAFAAALEEEQKHEQQLAHDAGVRA